MLHINVHNWLWPKLAHFLPLDKAQFATSGLVCQGAARKWWHCNFVANANDFSTNTATKLNQLTNASLVQGFLVMSFCNVVTVITTFSMSAVSTNGQIKGGGVYFMISR